MELRQLRYFIRIVELGSVSRAAKDLYIAQPALSAQITKLEDELGVKVLARSVRGVTTTKAGESLYLHAQAVLRQIDRLRHDVVNIGTKPAGPVSIGVPTSAANVLAGPLISTVQDRYPDIQLRIVESLSGHLQELVTNGRIEMSLLFEAPSDHLKPIRDDSAQPSHLRWMPLLEEQLFLLSKLQENDAESTTISFKQASTIGLVLPGQANLTRQLIDDAFNAEGYKPNIVAEIDSLSTIQSIVESGYASTILSKSAMVSKNKDTSIRARSIEGGGLKRRLSLCISDIVGYGTAAECVAALIPELVNSCILSGNWSGATSLQSPPN